MQILIPLMSVPVAILITWFLNFYGHWAHTSSEQVRIDASILSLCHHRRNFLRGSIATMNRRIQMLQIQMDRAAIACDAAPPPIKPEVCAILYSVGLESSVAEGLQELARRAYPAKQIALASQLKDQNRLTENE